MCKTEPVKPTPPADPSHYADPCQRCIGTILRVRLVDARNTSTGIEGATIYVSGKPSLTTDSSGWVRYDPIPSGTYDVAAEGIACHPARVERAGVVVPAGTTTEVVLEVTPCEFRLHVDADRDGAVDADWTDGALWVAGAGRKGAVILVNSDRDDAGRASGQDHDNDSVDTGTDLPDIAPLAVRKTIAGVGFPSTVSVTLTLADPAHRARIRIFDSRSGSASAIIGPSPAASHSWGADTLGDETMLGMEAVTYPAETSGRDIVGLVLTVKLGARTLHSQTVNVRIAPWMCYNHTFKTKKVQVLATSDNADFRTALGARVTAPILLNQGPGPTHGGDRWMQDVMEPGFSSMPRVGGPTSKWHTPVTMRSVQTRAGENYVRDEMLGPDHGLVMGGPRVGGETWDSFGNLECSPPFTHRVTGRNYAFGRLIYGGVGPIHGPGRVGMNTANVNFLNQQMVQEPFQIDTSWLQVGHVDEIISFLPHAGSTHGYKVVLANALSALRIVRAAPAGARMMTGYASATGVPGSNQTMSHCATKYPFHTAGAFRGDAAIVAEQARAQGNINRMRATLKGELDLEDSDFISFPVLFESEPLPGTAMIAHSPGSVNMLVLTKSATDVQLCVPKPFGPIVRGQCRFERAILRTLAGIGIPAAKVHFIDDFTTYHCLSGEIHCGTNSEREAPDGKWWWEMDWV